MPALNFNVLQAAITAAKRQFDLIRKKYPNLQAYLVLSLPGGQTGIGSTPREILTQFPDMVLDSPEKHRALPILSRLEMLEWKINRTPKDDALLAERKNLSDKLAPLLVPLRYDSGTQIELRFEHLNYDLIWQLQVDELVDRELTPQGKASIRIVLGTLNHFASQSHEH
jgi:hypothetical protein